ncbi:hypothetical protein [Cognatishimia sp. F0-27]|uniref:hypothetical protein n=1 Tax=Cognatishimia sp. F0-27 TaxID=2816855 RepID=UPI001D0C8882|nr:hypothetical protein [Cognatishimia sp. F0-27]MCC1494900.1 hypothetical protein [Cognatishimia sp. F0-27]
MSQEHTGPQDPKTGQTNGVAVNGVQHAGPSAPEGAQAIGHTAPKVDHTPTPDSDFWREDAQLRQERFESLARRMEAQRREAEALQAELTRLSGMRSTHPAEQTSDDETARVDATDARTVTAPPAEAHAGAASADTAQPCAAQTPAQAQPCAAQAQPDMIAAAPVAVAVPGEALDAPVAASSVAVPGWGGGMAGGFGGFGGNGGQGQGGGNGSSGGGGGGNAGAAPEIPADFGFEDEHPQIQLNFTLSIEGCKYRGESISLTHVIVRNEGDTVMGSTGRHVGLLTITFDSFTITLQPDLYMQEDRPGGRAVFRIADPTGPHLPQLRYILNSVIAGDIVGVDGMMRYSGPTAPKAAKAAAPKATIADRVRSIAGIVLSAALVLAALYVVTIRYTTAQELHPVYVARDGQPMRATTAGQIGYLNPDAEVGEVLFSVNANSGDVLNFVMPCDCEVAVTKGIKEGATVLQTDLILTVFHNSDEIRVQTLMSIEGLNRALSGDRVHMDMTDGRSIPVDVVASETTRAASMRGEMFVPVDLVPAEGALTEADIGKSAQLRLSKSLLGMAGLN